MQFLRFFAAMVALNLILMAGGPASADDEEGVWFNRESLNEGLSVDRNEIDLLTPQSAMETFLFAVQDGEYEIAAAVLDLSKLSAEDQAKLGPELARKLAVVMDRKTVISWRSLLERPDGLDANMSADSPVAGTARKSLLIGMLDMPERAVAIRLNRVKPKDEDAVWVFSRQTVDNIETLFELYGPTRFEKALPAWARADAFADLRWWEVIGLPLLATLTILLATWAWRVLGSGTQRVGAGVFGKIARGLRAPVVLALVTFIVQMATTKLFVVSGVVANILQPLILLGYVGAVLALIVNMIDVFLDRLVGPGFDDMSEAEAEERRAFVTTVNAVRRLIIVAAVLLAAGIVVTSSTTFLSLGFSLLASAGALTLLLGFAARNVLGNILSSMQISLNRSARIGDELIYEDELCQVEKIHFSFIQLRHWTGTRIIVPVSKFVSEDFKNRSMVDLKMTRVVRLIVTPHVDLRRMREIFHEILEEEPEAQPAEDAIMRVVDQDALGVELRFEIPSPDPATGFDIECRVREELIRRVRDIQSDGPVFPSGAAMADGA